jgi:hypothetical protein
MEIYKDFLLNIKQKFLIKDFKLKNFNDEDIDLKNLDLYQEISKYIVYLWYFDTNDDRITEKDYVIIPNNIERTFYFNEIPFLDISKILAHIKYNLLNDILDILNYNTFTEKNLKKFKNTDYQKLLNGKNINYNLKTKKEYIDFILKNKDKIFNKTLKIKKGKIYIQKV